MSRLVLSAALLALAAGCQPAARYQGRPVPAAEEGQEGRAKPSALSSDLQWVVPNDALIKQPVIRLDYVHHTGEDRAEWEQLKEFWNLPLRDLPRSAGLLLGPTPWTTGHFPVRPVIRLRVPLGLEDPRAYIPPTNPPTLPKWELGRRLFFDPAWLTADRKQSCAGCHDPEHGFADSRPTHPGGFNTPTLINCVYNRHQFWDGRVVYLEEVVQHTLEDERAASDPEDFRHVWGGVIGRLRADKRYAQEFRDVFGTPPTQNAVGQALATYLRTLLSGNALHDRAVAAQLRRGGKTLEPADYAGALTDKDLKSLGRPKYTKEGAAAELHRGYLLFHGRDPRHATNCIVCHTGRQFTDNQFHNTGIGWDPDAADRRRWSGRIRTAPVGLKEALLIGAYKTPTLRSLPQTGPYMHTGQFATLGAVIRYYDHLVLWNEFLDPLLRSDLDRTFERRLHLDDEEIAALVQFLRALDGEPVDPFVASPPR